MMRLVRDGREERGKVGYFFADARVDGIQQTTHRRPPSLPGGVIVKEIVRNNVISLGVLRIEECCEAPGMKRERFNEGILNDSVPVIRRVSIKGTENLASLIEHLDLVEQVLPDAA